jgi:hypothetical protein
MSLRESPDPGAFACAIIDRFVFVRQRLISKVICDAAAFMNRFPPLRCSRGNVRVVPQA